MNDDYFENIDCIKKAYWLGFLITDGSVAFNRVFLGLSLKDENVIDEFIKDLNIEPGRKRYHKHIINGKKHMSVTISFISKKIVEDIKKYKILPRKTFITEFTDLNNRELNLAMLSGCFDGDGCSRSSVLCSANYEFLNQIKSIFLIPYEIKLKQKNVYILSLGMDLLREAQNVCSLIDRKKPENFKKSKKTKKTEKQRTINYKQWLDLNNITAFELENLVSQYGLSSIGKKFGCSEKTIRKVCISVNITLPSLKQRGLNNRKCLRPSKEELIKLIEKTSYCEVGRMLGVSDNAVRKWLKS